MEQLRALLGPPERPVDIGWDAVWAQVGGPLPPDFVAFMDTYGPCSVGRLSIVRLGRGGYQAGITWDYERTRLWLRLEPGGFPEADYPLFPEAGGLIPWAADDAYRYYWRQAGADPAKWPIVMAPRIRGEVLEADRRATDIILDHAAAGATVSPSSLPDDVAWLEAPLPQALPARGAVPDDFERLIAEHGPGPLGGVLRLLPPGSDLPRPLPKALAGPSPLVPWGVFASGETCWWSPSWWTPNGWPVVVLDAEGVGWQRLSCTSSEFVQRWLAGRIDLPVLGAHIADDAPPHCTDLASIVGPPLPPTEIDWARTEAVLGTALPTAYKWIAERYGQGSFADDFQVHWPSGVFPTDLVAQHQELADVYREVQEADEDVCVGLTWFPDKDGLLHWAQVAGGECEFWWDTSASDPDDWTVLVGNHEWDDWVPTAYTTAEFLVRYFTGAAGERVSAPHTAHCPPGFIPADNQRPRPMGPNW
jgi:hypothetical protein